jgi:uncharacterized protein YecT (DUF1311 family)
MRIVKTFVLTFCALAYSIAWSEDNDFKCNPEGKQSQLNACAEDDFNNADRELNRVYKELMSKITSQKQDTLRKEQRVWLNERDPNCRKEANAEAEGGSMWPMIFNSCRATVTKARIQALQKWQ